MGSSVDPAFRGRLLLVNADQIGNKQRLNNPYTFHPMSRNSWESADAFRSILGRYRTVYTGSKGTQGYNYASVLNQLGAGGLPGAYESGPAGLGRLRTQLQGVNESTNIVFDYTMTTHATGAKYLNLIHGIQENAAWNGYTRRAPGAENYLTDLSNVYELINKAILHTGTGSLQDHASIFSLASEDKNIRRAAGYNLDVEPVYNYYTSTTPPYETVIGRGATVATTTINPRVKEYHLPNIYFLQSELNNTSSVPRALYHLPALTLNDTIPWFEIGNSQTVGSLTATENDGNRYYDMYAEGVVAMLSNSSSYQEIDADLNYNNRNFVVLHSDLGVVKEDRINKTTIPFYNKIILGNDQDGITGNESSISILQALNDDPDTRDFIDILQMQTVLRLTTQQSSASSALFMASHKDIHSSRDPSRFKNNSVEQDYKVLYDFNDLFTMYDQTNEEIEVASIINNFASGNPETQYLGTNLETLPFRLIRDYQLSQDQLVVDPAQVSNAKIDMYHAPNTTTALSRVVRSFEKVLDGTVAHTETLMYIIRKKTSPTATEAVQTFYISAEFRTGIPTVYFDAQVKYDTKYYYEIDKVVLVFGTQYRYAQLTSLTATNDPVYNENGDLVPVSTLPIKAKIEMEISPSVKAIVVPYVTGEGGIKSIILDKPPVPPEISFYPYKGVNDRLKILLNSSTGEYASSPVIINESDRSYFVQEYHSQTGDFSATYESMVNTNAKINFRSDDPVDAYEVFRLATAPQSYRAFEGTATTINPIRGVPGSFEDVIAPNTKYYYCARAIDTHGNRSNPTHIYEIEIVDNNGQIFIKQAVFSYEHPKEDFTKAGRRFIYIEPTLAQTLLDPNTAVGSPAVTTPPINSILGATDIDKVWNKKFKVRLTSTKTGRKVDLNLTFKNSGIVNASE